MERPATDNNPDNEHYLVKTRPDILSILRALARHKVPMRLQFYDRPVPVEARLLSVKPYYEELLFDGSKISNLVFVEGQNSLTASANYDYLHIRFNCDHVEAVRNHSAMAFRACIPQSLMRLQRRGSARFPVPADNPPVVRLLMGNEGTEIRMRVMDISLGGVCLILENANAAIKTGTILLGCKLELPRLGAINTNLEVVYTDKFDRQSGWQRLGCRFSGVSMLSLDHLRDYVAVLERARLDAS